MTLEKGTPCSRAAMASNRGRKKVEVGDDIFHEVFGGHDADVLEFAGDVDDAVTLENAHAVVVKEEELHWRASKSELGGTSI